MSVEAASVFAQVIPVLLLVLLLDTRLQPRKRESLYWRIAHFGRVLVVAIGEVLALQAVAVGDPVRGGTSITIYLAALIGLVEIVLSVLWPMPLKPAKSRRS